MNQNNLTFYSENLVVDWISFKFQHLEDSTKKKIANYKWYMDETYIKVKGFWMYQYRAVDKLGNTIDCYFSKNRDKKAATK